MSEPDPYERFIDCIPEEWRKFQRDECREKGVSPVVKLDGFKSLLILDGDRIDSQRKSCDCIIVAVLDGFLAICVAELRERVKDAREILEKASITAKTVEDMLRKCQLIKKLKWGFFPVIYHSRVESPAMSQFRKPHSRVAFRSRKEKMILRKHGIPLLDVVRNHAIKPLSGL